MNTETLVESPAVFQDSKMATNMPFFDGTTLAFCQSAGPVSAMIPTTGTIWKRIHQNKALAERMKNLPREQKVTYRAWKLAYCNWDDKIVRPINTGLAEKMAERSPAFYREDDRIHLSFISGVPTSVGFRYLLFACSGPDLEHLDTPKPVSSSPTYFGFVSPHHLCWGMMNTIQMSEKATGHNFRLRTSLHRVSSVNFVADDPTKLLITGLIDRQYRCQTILYDLLTGDVSDVSVGAPIYKSSMHASHVIFTQRRKDSFEGRELCHGEGSLSSSTVQISKEK